MLVVDAGLPGHWPQLTTWLSNHDYEFDAVPALVLTHADPDHVEIAKQLSARGVPVYCHPNDLPLLREQPAGAPGWFYRKLWHPGFLRYAIEMVRDGITDIDPLQTATPLSDGDTIPMPGQPEVIHAPGSCALYLADRATVFCGDVLATRSIYRDQDGDPQPLGAADENPAQARDALETLAELGHVTLLPGHGNPWYGDLDTALEHAR